MYDNKKKESVDADTVVAIIELCGQCINLCGDRFK